MSGYVVTWSIAFDAESTVDAADAADQAWGCIEDALHGGPATVLVVRDEDGQHLGTFDMARPAEPQDDDDNPPDDGKVLIAGVLYDAETGWEADEDGPPPDLNREGDPTLNGAFG